MAIKAYKEREVIKEILAIKENKERGVIKEIMGSKVIVKIVKIVEIEENKEIKVHRKYNVHTILLGIKEILAIKGEYLARVAKQTFPQAPFRLQQK